MSVDTTPTTERTTADLIEERFGDYVESVVHRLGETTITLAPAGLVDVATWLRDEREFAMCVDVTAVDCAGTDAPRFQVVYHLLSIVRRERLRLKVAVEEENPTVPSVVEVWPGANFFEREVYDMFGITFDGHPNLKRILMPEEWDGHPLRKDHPLGYEPVQFTHNVEQINRRKPYAES